LAKIIKSEVLDVELFIDKEKTRAVPSPSGAQATVRSFISFAFDQGGIDPQGRPITASRDRMKKMDRIEVGLNAGGDLIIDADDYVFLQDFFTRDFNMPMRQVAGPILDAIESAENYTVPKSAA